MTQRKQALMRGVGHFLVWADSYRVVFGIHALAIGPIDFESHLHTYLLVFAPLIDWFMVNSPPHRWLLGWVFQLPAAPVYLLTFGATTSLGAWLVRRSHRIDEVT